MKQILETADGRRNQLTPVPSGPVQHAPNQGKQFEGLDRLRQKVEVFVENAFFVDDIGRIAAHEDGLHVGIGHPDCVVHLFPVLFRHDHVKQEQIDVLLLTAQDGQCVLAVDRLDDAVAVSGSGPA